MALRGILASLSVREQHLRGSREEQLMDAVMMHYRQGGRLVRLHSTMLYVGDGSLLSSPWAALSTLNDSAGPCVTSPPQGQPQLQ